MTVRGLPQAVQILKDLVKTNSLANKRGDRWALMEVAEIAEAVLSEWNQYVHNPNFATGYKIGQRAMMLAIVEVMEDQMIEAGMEIPE